MAEERGRTIAIENCGQCHSVGKTGVIPVAAAPRWRELVEVRDIDGLAESEGSFVHSNGPVQMPEFTPTPVQIDDLLAYMKSLRAA